MNYYEMLGLSVESFEKDPVRLEAIAKKKIMEWQSHKKIAEQQKAQIHGENILNAIKDPAKWEEIYNEFKTDTDTSIEKRISTFANDHREVEKENIQKVADKSKVSFDYVKKICDAKKYVIAEGSSPRPKAKPTFTIDDVKPKLELKLKTLHDVVTSLGAADLMSLLENPEYAGVRINEDSSNDKVIEALKNAKEKWSKVSSTGPKATRRSQVDKVYSGFTDFLKDNPFEEYIKYLKYLKVKEILNDLKSSGVPELHEIAFKNKISELVEFVEDTEKSRIILMSFCDNAGIAYPVPRANTAICPFCKGSFEREDTVQKECPICHRSFLVQCPKCKSTKNLIVDTECDGINLGSYPFYENDLKGIGKCLDSLSLELARDKLNALEKKWPGFPGTAEVKTQIETLESKYGARIKNISDNIAAKKFFSAQAAIEQIESGFPGYKKNYGVVYSTIDSAEKAFEKALKEPDVDKKINLMTLINESVTDYLMLNAELQKYPIEPITGLSANTDSTTGVVTLSWSSKNKPDSVMYVVRRKQNSPINEVADGVEIGRTGATSFGDTNIEEGKPFYYAVFAMRGTMQSTLKALDAPTVLLKAPSLTIIPKDGCIDLSWERVAQKICIMYSTKEIGGYDEGTKINNISDAGVLIEKLSNGVPYYIAAYQYSNVSGKEFRSPLSVYPAVTPIKAVTPPRFSKLLGSKDGEYILKRETAGDEEIVFYYSETKTGIAENSVISLYDMERKNKKLNCRSTSNGEYIVDMEDKKVMFIYPAINISGSLTVGNIVSLSFIKLGDIAVSISGNSLCLSINEWPAGMDSILICYDPDEFPEDSKDCDRLNRINVTKTEFNRNPLLKIPNIKEMYYHISLFARSGLDETLIGNAAYDTRSRSEIYYTVTKNFFGGVKISIENSNGYRPALIFSIGNGFLPLSVEKAEFTQEIPENHDAPATEVISLKCHLPRDPYVRVFSKEPSYTVLSKGNTHLK